MNNTFVDWLLNEMNSQGLSQAALAKKADVSRTAISNLINGSRGMGIELCTAIAHALKIPPETVFRAAGLLPPVSEDDAEWEIWKAKLAQLSPENRQRFLRLMETELQYQEKQEERTATRKRKKTGPLPTLGG